MSYRICSRIRDLYGILRVLHPSTLSMVIMLMPLALPAGARGIYGGAVIAQCLSAAQRTVPFNFTVHSMHCYFVLAGNAEIPIIYHVERVRDGKSFCTRTVQARQRARAIFTVTLSFMRDPDRNQKIAQHAVPLPNVPDIDERATDYSSGPFESRHSPSVNGQTSSGHSICFSC